MKYPSYVRQIAYILLIFSNGVVKMSRESLKEIEVDFRITFIRYEKKKMYLIKSEGSFYLLAHFSVEECDPVHQGIADDAVEFPLRDRDRHYELEVCIQHTFQQ